MFLISTSHLCHIYIHMGVEKTLMGSCIILCMDDMAFFKTLRVYILILLLKLDKLHMVLFPTPENCNIILSTGLYSLSGKLVLSQTKSDKSLFQFKAQLKVDSP